VTDSQKRAAIAAEIARGAEALEEAELLLAKGKFAGAVSRAYYSAFHFARALLLTIGEEPRSHGGLMRLLQANFVRSGAMKPEVAGLLSRLMSYRQDADYTAEFVFTQAMASDEVGNARSFASAARQILTTGGWTQST